MVGKDRVVVVGSQIPAVTVPAILVKPPLTVCQHLHQILRQEDHREVSPINAGFL